MSDIITDVVAQVFKTLLAAGAWPLALAVLVLGAILVVALPKVWPIVGAALRRWHEATAHPSETTLNPDGSHKDGTGAPPIPLDQKPPTDWT